MVKDRIAIPVNGHGVNFDFDQQPFIVIWEVTRACGLACRHCRAEAVLRRHPARAGEVMDLLRWNGGGAHGSGTGIGNIDTQGNVHPDQFWQSLTLGNVKQRPFSEIWQDQTNETLAALRSRNGRLEGKCARCRFLNVCGGGFRVRAVQVHGNLWAPDPACYLTEEEIAQPV